MSKTNELAQPQSTLDKRNPSDRKTKTNQRRRILQLFRRDIFFWGLISLLAFLALLLAWPYLSAILFALAVVVIVKPLYNWFLKRRWLRGKTKWATILTIVTALLFVAVPIILFLSAAYSQAQDFISSLVGVNGGDSIQELLGSIEANINQASGGDNVQIDEAQATNAIQQLLNTVGGWLGDAMLSLGASLPTLFMGAIIALAIIMVLLPLYQHVSKKTIKELIPLPEQITELYISKAQMMITGMFRGTFVIAFAQGLAMGVVLWIAGVPNALFFTLLSMVSALLPVVGLSIVAWPIGIILLLNGQTWQGIWVLGAYLLVVQNIDVLLRPRLVPEGAYLNPALLLLGVFGGMQLLGPVGMLYGPVIMVLLVTSISVYTKYMLRSDLQPYLDADGKLDLEKMGLEEPDDGDKTEKKPGRLEKFANNVVGHLLKRSDPPQNPKGNATGAVPPANGDQTDPAAEPASPKSDT